MAKGAFPYEPTPSVKSTGGKPPARGPQPGTIAIASIVDDKWGHTTRDGGTYNPRPMNLASGPGKLWSVHAKGSANDIMLPMDRSRWPNGHPVGHEIAQAMVAAHEVLGIQQVIWAGRVWTVGKGYRNLSARSLGHYDHIHWEMIQSKAESVTRPFAARALDVKLVKPSTFLRLGDSGEWVQELRWWLGLDVGDLFDEEVHEAVNEVQKVCQVGIDGIAGPATWECVRRDVVRGLDNVYRRIDNREPDTGGFAYWSARLNADDATLNEVAELLRYDVAQRSVAVAPLPAPQPVEAPTPTPAPARQQQASQAPLTDAEILDGIADLLLRRN